MVRILAFFLTALSLFGQPHPVRTLDPVNPEATEDARKILTWMAKLPSRWDRRVISGQHFGRTRADYETFIEGLHGATEKWVALAGADVGYTKTTPDNFPGYDLDELVDVLIDYWNSGGLITLSYHAKNPWTGGNSWDTEPRDLKELVTPGNPAHELYMKELDRVAGALAKLRDAGAVVIWRPFHEVNGGWFWWGHRKDRETGEDFVSLWRHQYRYFTETKKLNNLLWAYSPSSNAHERTSVMFYYPGDDHVDIVGVDLYSNDTAMHGYDALVRLDKPFGLTEFGPRRDSRGTLDYEEFIRKVRRQYPLTSFILPWHTGWSILENKNGKALMEHPWIIDRDELDWQRPGHRRWAREQPLAINGVKVLTERPAAWERVEFRVDLSATFDTPFDRDQIALDAVVETPSGKTMRMPGFFYQPFERQMWGGNDRVFREHMVESGPPEWRVRFTPTEAGEHSVTMEALDRTGSARSETVRFTAASGESRGFIRVSKTDPSYFEFDDGTPYFANGLNIVEHPLSEYYRYLPRLAEAGGNFARLWIGFEYFGLELGTIGDYRLDNAWYTDQVMELSEKHGIYQKICIEYMRYIWPDGPGWVGRKDWAYGAHQGGPCRDMVCFFQDPEARRLFKNRLRYIVARWGYSPYVMAWELWNENNLVEKAASDPAIIVPWNKEMNRYLRSIDPYQHLTTNSLSGRDLWLDFWELDENEFVQRHGYFSVRQGQEEAPPDMAELVSGWLDDVDDFGKPYFMSEFGLQRDRRDMRGLCDLDDEGVNLHNGMWAALAHGAAGVAQLWWWGQYVDPKDLYFHYRAVATFAKDVPWTTAGFERAEVSADNPEVRVLGLRGGELSLLWIHNKRHNWWNVITEEPISAVQPDVKLDGVPDGAYRLEFWDTWRGEVIDATDARASGGFLSFTPPEVERDLAVKIRRR